MPALYSHMPRPFWWALVGFPVCSCTAAIGFICSHCTNHWSCSYTALLKNDSVAEKKEFPLASYDAVRSVVSSVVTNFYIYIYIYIYYKYCYLFI